MKPASHLRFFMEQHTVAPPISLCEAIMISMIHYDSEDSKIRKIIVFIIIIMAHAVPRASTYMITCS